MNIERHIAMKTQGFLYFQIGFALAMRNQRMIEARRERYRELRTELVKQARYWQSLFLKYLSESPAAGAG